MAPTQPACAYVGSSPMAPVAMPMIATVHSSVVRRPSRSPMCPKIAAPIGRTTNASAIVEKDARVSPNSPSGSKNSGPRKKAEK